MFCNECGKSIPEGSKFCLDCGSPLPVATQQAVHVAAPVKQPPPQAAQQPPPDEEEKEKKAGGFWVSGAGIALIAILGFAVIAGATLGIIFLVKGNSNGEVDAATMSVWDEYQSVLADDSTSLAQVNMDPTALTKTREDLDKTQKRVEALEKVLQKTGGTAALRNPGRVANNNPTATKTPNNNPTDTKAPTSNPTDNPTDDGLVPDSTENGFNPSDTKNPTDNPTGTTTQTGANNTQDTKAIEMAAALESYKKYIEKMNELYGVLVSGNMLDPVNVNLVNAILKDLQALANDVKTTAGDFLQNNTKVITKTFNPPVLSLPKTIATTVEKDIQVKQEAERQRVAAEQAAAAAAAAELQKQQEAAPAAEAPGPSDTWYDPNEDDAGPPPG